MCDECEEKKRAKLMISCFSKGLKVGQRFYRVSDKSPLLTVEAIITAVEAERGVFIDDSDAGVFATTH